MKIGNPNFYKFLDYVNKNVSSDTQRLIAGATAIVTQPVIDLCNKKVDDETRWTSAMRTIAKIIVGTTVGVTLRHYSIKLARNSSMFWKHAGDKFNIPEYPGKDFWKKIDFSKKEHREINSYANTVGTVIGTGAGLITNFVIDAPLTKLLTNYLNENVKPTCMNTEAAMLNDKKQKGENRIVLSA